MNQITVTFTAEQLEIIGYALVQTRRNQMGKMQDCLDLRPDAISQIEGFRERIAKLEDALHALPAEVGA